MNKNKINYTISLVRIVACLLIIYNHTTGLMFDGYGNPWNWANTGVQVFFFMSGFLYGNKEVSDSWSWLRRQLVKIAKPYHIYLIIIIPVILLLAPQLLNAWNVLCAIFCVQGFGPHIEGLGQQWFVTYIILCYIINAFVLSKPRFRRLGAAAGGKYWSLFILVMLLCQVLTLPLAVAIKLKSAYLFTFIVGYCYTLRFGDGQREHERRIWSISVVVLALAGYALRYYIETTELTGMAERLGDMMVQYIKMVWACAIFVIMTWLIPSEWWSDKPEALKHALVIVAAYTYEAYLVHEFFLHQEFLELIPGGFWVQFFVAMLSIPISAWALHHLSKTKNDKTIKTT